MDGIGIRIEENVTPMLAEMARRMRNFTPIMPALKVIGIDSIEGNFDAEGRPTKWRPLAIVPANRRGGKILSHSTRLRRSIVSRQAGKTSIEFGTSLDYAAAHDQGVSRTVQVRAHTRTIRQAFGRSIPQTAVQVPAGSRRMRLPQRRFLVIVADDLAEMEHTAAEYLLPKMER
jgi:phage gpG-like protein